MTRGYFEIGVYHPKTGANIGTLWRSAFQLGASGIFVIGARYRHQSSDTVKAYRHVPLRHFDTFDSFFAQLPHAAPLVGIEMGGRPLGTTSHPESGVYLLGAEDHGLPQHVMDKCHRIISLEAMRTPSFNVAVAGSIVMYDRMLKLGGQP